MRVSAGMECGKARVITWLLALSMALGIVTPGAGAAGDEPKMEGPRVEISCVKVKSTQTLELGFNVEASGFKSVGAVLKFDNTKLGLVSWEDTESLTPLTVPDTAVSWDTAASLAAARGSDEAAAKPSLAYRDGNWTYLYLSGGLFTYQDVKERILTVRFQYLEDEDGSKFAKLGKAQVGASGSELTLADATIAQSFMPGPVQCTVAGDTAQVAYTYRGEPSGLYPVLESVEWLEPREGASQVVTDGAEVVGVTFLDWDGTVIDTAALPLVDDVSGLVKSMVNTEDSRMNAALMDGNKTGYHLEGWLDCAKLSALETPPLTANNNGLDRDQYGALLVDLGDFYNYVAANHPPKEGARSAMTLQACYRANQAPDGQGYADDFVPVTAGASNYSLNEGKPETGGIYYTRYGYASATNGKYAVRVQLGRVHPDGLAGVERIQEPGLLVHMHTKTGEDTYSFLRVDNREIIQAEMVPTRDMEWVEFYLADTYNVSAWPNAPSRTGGFKRIDMADVIRYGTANYIMEQAYLELSGSTQSEWNLFVDEQAFLDATGTAIVDLDETKRLFLQWMQEVYFPEVRAEAEPALMSEGDELDIPDAPTPMADLPAAGWFPPSYDDFLDTYDKLGVEVTATVRSNDPQKQLTCGLYQWDEKSGGFQGPVNSDLHPVPLWTAAEEQKQGWTGNGAGTGAYDQAFTLSGLQPGRYQLRVRKLGHTSMIAEFELNYKRSQIADSGLPKNEQENQLPVDLNPFATQTAADGPALLLPCGDVDGDGYVRMNDWSDLTSSGILGQLVTGPEDSLAVYDLNGDRHVDIVDVGILLDHMAKGPNQVTITIP